MAGYVCLKSSKVTTNSTEKKAVVLLFLKMRSKVTNF